MPGLQTLVEVFCCSAPSRNEIVKINTKTTKIFLGYVYVTVLVCRAGCARLLGAGAVVGVAPGGAGQSMLGLDWAARTGYAVTAVNAARHTQGWC